MLAEMVAKHALVTRLTQHMCPHTQVSHILLFVETKKHTLVIKGRSPFNDRLSDVSSFLY